MLQDEHWNVLINKARSLDASAERHDASQSCSVSSIGNHVLEHFRARPEALTEPLIQCSLARIQIEHLCGKIIPEEGNPFAVPLDFAAAINPADRLKAIAASIPLREPYDRGRQSGPAPSSRRDWAGASKAFATSCDQDHCKWSLTQRDQLRLRDACESRDGQWQSEPWHARRRCARAILQRPIR